MDPVRFAIVGVGGFARTHLRGISSLQDSGSAILTDAVVRRPGHYADQVADLRARDVRIHASIEDLLSLGGFDVVCLPTGIHLHVPQTEACLQAGHHVVCEKPIAARIQDADRMIAAVADSDKHVIIGYQAIFTHAIQTIKARILEGRIGKVHRICVKGGWPRDDAYYARNAWAGCLRAEDDWILDSPINNAFAHDVNNALFLCGGGQLESAEPLSVQAELYRARDIQSPDTASLRIRTTHGVEIVIALSHVTQENFDPSLVVHGELGRIHWSQKNGVTQVVCANGDREAFDNGGADAHILPFENAVDVLAGRSNVLSTPVNARAQTLAINGAHESCPEIIPFPADVVKESLRPGKAGASSRFLSVEGLDDLVHRSFEEGRLFSELGADWARPSPEFPLADYRSFPSRPTPF